MKSTFSAELANNPDIVHAVFESLPEPTFLLNKSGTYLEAWGGRDTERHHDPSVLVGLNQYEVLPPDKAVWFSQVIVDVIDSQTASVLEYSLDPSEMSCFDGIEGPTQVQHFSSLVIPVPNTSYVLWTVRNITEYKQAVDKLAQHQLELEKLTYVDHLTQIYNRYALDALLPSAIEMAKVKLISCAVFMIDIDCFKEYNDHFGHLKGDDILRALSSTIREWSKEQDLCFRYGGDEFLVFISDVTQSETIQRAKQLQQRVFQLAIPHPTSSVREVLSVTIGIKHCQVVTESMSIAQFISIADKALFFAKGRQRGSIHLMA